MVNVYQQLRFRARRKLTIESKRQFLTLAQPQHSDISSFFLRFLFHRVMRRLLDFRTEQI